MTDAEIVRRLTELQQAVRLRQYSYFHDCLEDFLAALESQPPPLAVEKAWWHPEEWQNKELDFPLTRVKACKTCKPVTVTITERKP